MDVCVIYPVIIFEISPRETTRVGVPIMDAIGQLFGYKSDFNHVSKTYAWLFDVNY